VNVGTLLPADPQPFELVQPGEGPLHDPAVAAKAQAVRHAPPAITGRIPRDRSARR
jgi:hypothetical protein